MPFPRASGILLHPTSLPGDHGIGDLGSEAFAFVDFLVRGGQQLWQVLPLTHAAVGDSPYTAYSSYAGNPLLISLDRLVDAGLLTRAELDPPPRGDERKVDYERVRAWKLPRLRRAFETFGQRCTAEQADAFAVFCQAHSIWLDNYALFMALSQAQGAHPGRLGRRRFDCGSLRRWPGSARYWRRRLSTTVSSNSSSFANGGSSSATPIRAACVSSEISPITPR